MDILCKVIDLEEDLMNERAVALVVGPALFPSVDKNIFQKPLNLLSIQQGCRFHFMKMLVSPASPNECMCVFVWMFKPVLFCSIVR